MTVTRFAPSPTWYVHIWGLRTVLYNYLYAKHKGGKFLLRIEDTDRTRLVDGSVENIIAVLEKTWVAPDEGPHKEGNVWPYTQSERLPIYRKYIDELIAKDKAYYCFCSSERLTKLREEQEEAKLPTKYDKKCRYLSDEEINANLEAGIPYTVRLKVPDNEKVVFKDAIKGKIEIETKDVDDQVLLKTDGFPTYHMACVVDDHLMGVTDVLRWDEWVPSTPKHVLLYKAFGWEEPTYYHLPLIMAMDGKKLSKRNGDVSVESYLEKGYLTEALINYLALLGWNPKTTEEIFSMEELIERFEPKNINKSWAVFDVEKLDWFNSKYLVKTDIEELYPKLKAWAKEYDEELKNTLENFDDEYSKKILNELKTKIKKFNEFKESTNFFYSDEIKFASDLLVNEKMKIADLETAKKSLEVAKEVIENLNWDENINDLKEIFVAKIKEAEMKNGQVLWPTRVALTGEQFTPGALEMIYILGKDKALQRLNTYINQL